MSSVFKDFIVVLLDFVSDHNTDTSDSLMGRTTHLEVFFEVYLFFLVEQVHFNLCPASSLCISLHFQLCCHDYAQMVLLIVQRATEHGLHRKLVVLMLIRFYKHLIVYGKRPKVQVDCFLRMHPF